jgi:hypothetical protein
MLARAARIFVPGRHLCRAPKGRRGQPARSDVPEILRRRARFFSTRWRRALRDLRIASTRRPGGLGVEPGAFPVPPAFFLKLAGGVRGVVSSHRLGRPVLWVVVFSPRFSGAASLYHLEMGGRARRWPARAARVRFVPLTTLCAGMGVEWMENSGNAPNVARRSADRDRIRNFVRAAGVETQRGRLSIRGASAGGFRAGRAGRSRTGFFLKVTSASR